MTVENDVIPRTDRLTLMATTFFAMYLMLYIGSWVHESGHAVAALLSGGYFTDFQVYPWTGGIVRVFQGNLTIIALAGGLSQAVFYLTFVKWEKTMVVPYFSCVVYALVEAILIPYQSYAVVYASVTFIMSLVVVLATSLLLKDRVIFGR